MSVKDALSPKMIKNAVAGLEKAKRKPGSLMVWNSKGEFVHLTDDEAKKLGF